MTLREVLTDDVMRDVLVVLPPPDHFAGYAAAVRDRLIALHSETTPAGVLDEAAIDPRVVEAFDLLGGMWSWSEDNGYFATGHTWPLQAGRLLREVVGRPARPPAAALGRSGGTE